MTLQEAVNSGKNFARKIDADLGDYMSADDFLEGGISIDDLNATDYELEPSVGATINKSTLVDAWNTARGSRNTIAAAGTSSFFKDFTTILTSKGITIVNDITL